MAKQKTFTVDQLREAFRLTFHKSGDVFFSYFGEEWECQNSTEAKWLWFLENLDSKTAEIERFFLEH